MSQTTKSKYRPASAVAAVLTAATLVAAPIAAQAQMAPMKTEGWQTNLTLYAWLPGFSGQTSFPADSGGSGINVNADTIIDNLKMVFMGTLDVHNGRWGVFNDLIYMDVGSDKSKTRDFSLGGASLPANLTADLGMDLKAWVWTVAGEYRVMASPNLRWTCWAGVRMLDLTETLNYSLFGNIASTGFNRRAGSLEVEPDQLGRDHRRQGPLRVRRQAANGSSRTTSTSGPARATSPGRA